MLLFTSFLPLLLSYILTATSFSVRPRLLPIKGHKESILTTRTKYLGFESRFTRAALSYKEGMLRLQMALGPSEEELAQQKVEAIQEYSKYHDGVWRGKRVTSFSITSDVAAGVTKKIDNKDTTGNGIYKTFFKTLMDPDGLRVQETISWEEDAQPTSTSSITSRSIKLSESVDIDSVDASYSLDASPLLDIPTIITGTNAVVKFGIEHCIAVSDNERVRCFLLYDMEDKLTRVAVCDELRVAQDDDPIQFSQLSAQEEMDAAKNDVDQLVDKLFGVKKESPETNDKTYEAFSTKNKIDANTSMEERMQKLQNALQKNKNGTSNDDSQDIKRSPMSMFGLISGVWLGDSIVRNHPESPSTSNKIPAISGISKGFAEWSTGVQKVAMEYKWDFEDRVMQRHTAGRSLGVSISNQMPATSMGMLIHSDMARGKDPEDRLAYVDFDMGMYAGFLLGSVYIKAPRSLSFSQSTGKVQPFFTEFAVFQKKINPASSFDSVPETSADLTNAPELYCSRLTRLYGNSGRLKQGTSSFFKLESIANKQ